MAAAPHAGGQARYVVVPRRQRQVGRAGYPGTRRRAGKYVLDAIAVRAVTAVSEVEPGDVAVRIGHRDDAGDRIPGHAGDAVAVGTVGNGECGCRVVVEGDRYDAGHGISDNSFDAVAVRHGKRHRRVVRESDRHHAGRGVADDPLDAEAVRDRKCVRCCVVVGDRHNAGRSVAPHGADAPPVLAVFQGEILSRRVGEGHGDAALGGVSGDRGNAPARRARRNVHRLPVRPGDADVAVRLGSNRGDGRAVGAAQCEQLPLGRRGAGGVARVVVHHTDPGVAAVRNDVLALVRRGAIPSAAPVDEHVHPVRPYHATFHRRAVDIVDTTRRHSGDEPAPRLGDGLRDPLVLPLRYLRDGAPVARRLGGRLDAELGVLDQIVAPHVVVPFSYLPHNEQLPDRRLGDGRGDAADRRRRVVRLRHQGLLGAATEHRRVIGWHVLDALDFGPQLAVPLGRQRHGRQPHVLVHESVLRRIDLDHVTRLIDSQQGGAADHVARPPRLHHHGMGDVHGVVRRRGQLELELIAQNQPAVFVHQRARSSRSGRRPCDGILREVLEEVVEFDRQAVETV